MILAGHWAMTSDDEQDTDWMRVVVGDTSVTFVRQSALEERPGETSYQVMLSVLDDLPPHPPATKVA